VKAASKTKKKGIRCECAVSGSLDPGQSLNTFTPFTMSPYALFIVSFLALCCVATGAEDKLKDMASATPEEKEKFVKHLQKLKEFIDEGKKHGEKKDWEKALKSFQAAIEFEPLAMDGFFYLGNTLHVMGKTDAAILAYRRVTELAPDSAQGHSNLGVCLSDAGNHDEAIVAHKAAHKLSKDDVRVLVNLGKAFLNKNTEESVEEAKQYFKTALVIDANNADAKMGLEVAEMGVAKTANKDDLTKVEEETGEGVAM
jgi:tetratricopeptide (TPR) repeat protein